MGWNRHLRKWVREWFDVPAEIINEETRIEWIGNTSLHIENHQGIEWFQHDEIRLHSKHGLMIIKGKQLRIELINQYEVRVLGSIEVVRYGL